MVRSCQRAHAQDAARASGRPARPRARADGAAARAGTRCRPALGDQGAARPHLRFDTNDYSLDPGLVGRRVEVRVSQRELLAVALDTGELACRHQRSFARHRTITGLAHARALRAGRDAEPVVEIRPLARYDALIA